MEQTKTRKIKAWGVFWKKESRPMYGIKSNSKYLMVGEDCHVNQRVRLKGTMKYKTLPLWASYVAFDSKKSAEIFRDKNTDWEVRSIEITYQI